MKLEKIAVKLESLSDIMFDRFIDHSREERPPEQKLYLDGNKIVLPAENIFTFLFGESPGGCAKTFEGKKGKDYIRTGAGHIVIDPQIIPFVDEKEKPIHFENFNNGRFRVDVSSPRVKNGNLTIKQEAKKRPVLNHPWALKFNLTIVENKIIDENKLKNWFEAGGLLVALGTWRPRYGRFMVREWKKIK